MGWLLLPWFLPFRFTIKWTLLLFIMTLRFFFWILKVRSVVSFIIFVLLVYNKMGQGPFYCAISGDAGREICSGGVDYLFACFVRSFLSLPAYNKMGQGPFYCNFLVFWLWGGWWSLVSSWDQIQLTYGQGSVIIMKLPLRELSFWIGVIFPAKKLCVTGALFRIERLF